MKCIKCESEIENDDNFCWKCGYWTRKGEIFLKDNSNVNKILNGEAVKQDEKLTILMGLLGIGSILFIIMMIIQGNDLFKPFIYLKKQAMNYTYGYNTSMIKTDNKYSNEQVNNYEEALQFIKNDFKEQTWLCEKNIEVTKIEYELGSKYNIPSVSFCDASYEVSLKIKNIIEEMYNLFPSIKGSLTNITITNANSKQEYIAYFQPLYQFININEDINSFNKVNKTQILLNSYYFLNNDMLKKDIGAVVGENYYVNDATWESTIAHEFGHYISFVILLKEQGLPNITFETSKNYSKINNIIEIFNRGTHSNDIVNEALQHFNTKYNLDYDVKTFASSISNYATKENENGILIADETIAEAVHDYYLHRSNMKPSSKEIVEVLKRRMG